jgi:hypothetical protein
MKQNTIAYNLFNGLAWVAIIIIMFKIGQSLSLRTYMDDDVYFVNALKDMSLFSFLEMRYMTWSGRVIIEAIMVKTINHEYVWRFLVPVCLFILCHSICKISTNKNKFSPTFVLLIMIIFFLMPNKTYNEGAIWVTGFYNYLLPISLGFYAISVLSDDHESTITQRILSIISLPVACSNEQMGLTIIIYLVISHAIKRKANIYTLAFSLIAILSFSFLMLAPGNKIRVIGESRRIPEFSDYGFLDKVGLGLDRFSSMINGYNTLLIILSILLVALYFITNKSRISFFGITSSVIVIAFQITKAWGLIPNQFMGNGDWNDWVFYIRYSISLIFYINLIYLAFQVLNVKYDYIALAAIVFAPATVLMIGFSPTVYASADRVLFMFECLLLLVTFSCATKLIPK